MNEQTNSVKNGVPRSLLSPLLFFAVIFLIRHLCYLLLNWVGFVEILLVVSIFFYLLVLLVCLAFMRESLRNPLSEVFRVRSFGFTLVALVFSIIFQAVWITFNFNLGGVLVQGSGGLEGYEFYPTFSFPLALVLYFLLLLLGAYVEEVAFRGYIQSKVGYGGRKVAGVIVASLLFSIQSINVFQLDQILNFLQTDFIYYMCFSIFIGYLFLKTRGDIWSVFAFHALTRIIEASLPVKITYVFPYFRQIVAIASFVFLILILRLIPFTELIRQDQTKEEKL